MGTRTLCLRIHALQEFGAFWRGNEWHFVPAYCTKPVNIAFVSVVFILVPPSKSMLSLIKNCDCLATAHLFCSVPVGTEGGTVHKRFQTSHTPTPFSSRNIQTESLLYYSSTLDRVGRVLPWRNLIPRGLQYSAASLNGFSRLVPKCSQIWFNLGSCMDSLMSSTHADT